MSSKEANQAFFGHYWNEHMITYLSKSAGGRWFSYLLGLILDKIPVQSVASVADVGCGVGAKTARMAKYFTKAAVTGYDFSEAGIAAAKKYYRIENLHFATEDITESEYKTKFDVITAFDILEHIDDWKALTKKLISVNNKYMIISSPVGRMRPYEVNIGHYRNFKKREIEEFMEANGYATIQTFYAGFPFYSPIVRDLTNMFFKNYSEIPESEMSFLSQQMHDVWYFLFRYCSFKHRGDIFVGLFEKREKKSAT